MISLLVRPFWLAIKSKMRTLAFGNDRERFCNAVDSVLSIWQECLCYHETDWMRCASNAWVFNEQELSVSCYTGKNPSEASALVSFSSTPWQSFLPATAEEENKGEKKGNKCCLCLDLVQSPYTSAHDPHPPGSKQRPKWVFLPRSCSHLIPSSLEL